MRRLRYVNFEKFFIRKRSINDLTPMSHCKMLQTVIITNQTGVIDLSPLMECSLIKDLYIYGTSVNEECLMFFKRNRPFCKVWSTHSM